jgi:hypothetical protein
MTPRRHDRCGTRFRRAAPDLEPPTPVTDGDEVSLTPLGQQFIDALREDERFRDIIADPFGDQGPAAA